MCGLFNDGDVPDRLLTANDHGWPRFTLIDVAKPWIESSPELSTSQSVRTNCPARLSRSDLIARAAGRAGGRSDQHSQAEDHRRRHQDGEVRPTQGATGRSRESL